MEPKRKLEDIIADAKSSLEKIEKEIGEFSPKKDEGDEGFELFMQLKKEGLSLEERENILKNMYHDKK